MAAARDQFLVQVRNYLSENLPRVGAYRNEAKTWIQQQAVEVLSLHPGLFVALDANAYPGSRGGTALVKVRGTIQITYRGSPYNIPVNIVLPENFPTTQPLCFVEESPGLMLKPNHQVVDGKSGLCNLRSTAYWQGFQSSLASALNEMLQEFSSSPPLYAGSSQPPSSSSHVAPAPASAVQGNHRPTGSFSAPGAAATLDTNSSYLSSSNSLPVPGAGSRISLTDNPAMPGLAGPSASYYPSMFGSPGDKAALNPADEMLLATALSSMGISTISGEACHQLQEQVEHLTRQEEAAQEAMDRAGQDLAAGKLEVGAFLKAVRAAAVQQFWARASLGKIQSAGTIADKKAKELEVTAAAASQQELEKQQQLEAQAAAARREEAAKKQQQEDAEKKAKEQQQAYGQLLQQSAGHAAMAGSVPSMLPSQVPKPATGGFPPGGSGPLAVGEQAYTVNQASWSSPGPNPSTGAPPPAGNQSWAPGGQASTGGQASWSSPMPNVSTGGYPPTSSQSSGVGEQGHPVSHASWYSAAPNASAGGVPPGGAQASHSGGQGYSVSQTSWQEQQLPSQAGGRPQQTTLASAPGPMTGPSFLNPTGNAPSQSEPPMAYPLSSNSYPSAANQPRPPGSEMTPSYLNPMGAPVVANPPQSSGFSGPPPGYPVSSYPPPPPPGGGYSYGPYPQWPPPGPGGPPPNAYGPPQQQGPLAFLGKLWRPPGF